MSTEPTAEQELLEKFALAHREVFLGLAEAALPREEWMGLEHVGWKLRMFGGHARGSPRGIEATLYGLERMGITTTVRMTLGGRVLGKAVGA